MKFVYLRHHTDAKKIIAIASIDTSISAEDCITLFKTLGHRSRFPYSKKSFLGLASECQSTDYDSQIAYANLSALRDILIEYKKRTEKNLVR